MTAMFNRRIEPPAGKVLHGAGQSVDAFADYTERLAPYKPSIYMTYVGLKGLRADYFERLGTQLDRYRPDTLIPQIGLSMTTDGSPEQRYEDKVAAGECDAQIATFVAGVKALQRPVFVRIGYEFNGHWNGYREADFPAAWRRVADPLRKEVPQAATVWCYAPDGNKKNYMDFYPGDAHVDWWGIDLFSVEHFTQPDSIAFMEDALRNRFPVMIGESTPRYVGVQDGPASWDRWFVPYFDFIHRFPNLKAFCYISWDWSTTRMWANWGDGRVGANAEVFRRYREELARPCYVHAAPGA